MSTIKYILTSLILIVLFYSCSDLINVNENSSGNKIITNKVELLKCCNLERPEQCEENEKRSLLTDIGDIEISCECCQELWDFYGGSLPPGSQIPHIIIGIQVCIPNE